MAMGIGSILFALLMFGVMIFVHELGHFIAAKWAGIKVNEFAIGMGPILFSRDRGETRYSLRLFPMGGFCAMEGDDEESSDRRAFGNAPLFKRIVVIIAGSVMNILLGFALLAYLTTCLNLIPIAKIATFEENAPSSRWLQVGDRITRMNGHRVDTRNDIIYEFTRDRDGVMDMVVIRGEGTPEEETVHLSGVTFRMDEAEGGILIPHLDFNVYGVHHTVGGTARHAANWTVTTAKTVWGGLADLISGRFGLPQMTGPVGITKEISREVTEAASTGDALNLIYFMAFITVNLGVMNLLPLPALDGGRLLFLFLELVRRKPVNPKYEGYVHAAGFMLLIGFMLVVTFQDVIKLFQG